MSDETIRKSDRPTIFINVIGMSEEELQHVHEDLNNSGITKNYRPILANTPIQVLNESQMGELIKEWMQGNDFEDKNASRVNDIRTLLTLNTEAWLSASHQFMALSQNLMHIEEAFARTTQEIMRQFNGIAADVNGQPMSMMLEAKPFNRLMSNSENTIKVISQQMVNNTPVEGQEW